MIYTLAGIYAGALAVYAATRWLLRRRKRNRVLDRWQKAIPRWSDPEAPTMSEERCAELGHLWVRKQPREYPLLLPWRSCGRCGAFERLGRTAEDHDFDVRR